MYIKRSSGAKLLFYDVKGDGAKIQVMADLRCRLSEKPRLLHLQAPYYMHNLTTTQNLHGDARLACRLSIGCSPRRSSGLAPEDFVALHNSAKRGDIVGVEGFPGKSKMGELSIFPRKFVVLSPCLHMPPTVRSGLKDQVRSSVALSVSSKGSHGVGS